MFIFVTINPNIKYFISLTSFMVPPPGYKIRKHGSLNYFMERRDDLNPVGERILSGHGTSNPPPLSRSIKEIQLLLIFIRVSSQEN